MKRIGPQALLLFFLTACVYPYAGDSENNEASSDAITLRFVYSPEKEQWLQARFILFNRSGAVVNNRPIFVQGIQKSSVVATAEILDERLQPVIWSPSSSIWLEMLEERRRMPKLAKFNRPLVYTPLVIAMWKPMAEELGWPSKPIGWTLLRTLAQREEGWAEYGHPEWGKFTWRQSDPATTTTGLAAMLAEYYVSAGKKEGLTENDKRAVDQRWAGNRIMSATHIYTSTTASFLDDIQKYGLTYVSAFPIEEHSLINFNRNTPPVPLVAIYPFEGTFQHDHPFIVLTTATHEEQLAAQKLYEYLFTPESQNDAVQYGFRPANRDVPVGAPVVSEFGVDPNKPQQLFTPPSGSVIAAVHNAWTGENN